MADDARALYAPINTLKPIARNVWLVDGDTIRFSPSWATMPFPTRMTLIRLGAGNLFIHSPTALTPSLQEEIAAIGTPRWIVGPNRIHYWWIPEWRRAYAQADIYLAPGIREQAGQHIDFAANDLSRVDPYPWAPEIETLAVASRYMTEFEFFHRESRTLVLTDLIENFEGEKLNSRLMRWLTWLGGVQDPHGSMPRDMRMTFTGRRAALRRAVETMIAWQPERVVLAHGRWYEADGAVELRRAFAWLLK